MSRVLKFRAWDGKQFLPLAREVAFIDDAGVLRSRIEGIVFEQFTGMIDKNGKEIYEGDILFRDHYRQWPTKVDGPRTAELIATYPLKPILVEWDEYSCGYEPFASQYAEESLSFPSELIEVVGNIHEHPELLKR